MIWNEKLPLIAILLSITPAEVLEHVQVLLDAGFETVEIPTNSPDWEQSIAKAVTAFGDRALNGARTVLTVAQVKACRPPARR